MGQFTFFVNFKTYPEATGEKAAALAKICFKVGRQTGQTIIPLVQAVDLYRVKKEAGDLFWTQHLDWFEAGAHTGWISPEAVLAAGASGTLLGHSEHQLPPGTIKRTIKRVRELDKNFQVMVCARTLGQLEKRVFLKPDFLAYEPPELIGGEISVSQAQPGVIRKAKRICHQKGIPLVVGAGVNSAQDVLLAKKLGAAGVLVSSAVVLAKNPEEKLREMVKGKAHGTKQDIYRIKQDGSPV